MRFIYIIVYFLFSKNFYVINFLSLKVLDANYGCLMWDYLGYDSQLWFWDGAEIHSKKYPNFVLDVDSKIAVENGWSRLTLFPKACGLKRTQWKIEGKMSCSIQFVHYNFHFDILVHILFRL